jgi:acetyl-CoA synthetase
LRDGFGQTETTALAGNSPGQVLKPGSMGRPLPGYRVVLVNADGEFGDEGEIALQLQPRPLGLMVGYQGDDEKNAEVMRDGLYRTGDVATRDADGFITYVGRADDVFKSAGYRISPFELESVAIEHDAIAEAAVVSSPDAVRGTVPKIFIVLATGHAPTPVLAEKIFAFLRARLAPYKRARRLQFAELPKTISGKIRRVDLRAAEIKLRASGERAADEYFEEDFKAADTAA